MSEKKITRIEGGVTAAEGFEAAAAAAGIKNQGRDDMALIYSGIPCRAAGTFTTNLVKAAPVKWDQEIVYHQPSAQAVVINSGVANVFGEYDAQGKMIRQYAYECSFQGYRVMKDDFSGFWFAD